jgi:hypothetical protein
MTIEANDTVERYDVNGTGPYAFSFRIFAESDLSVRVINDSTGTPVSLTLDADYTVTGVDDEDGGSIELSADAASDYASGYTLDIRSTTPLTQPTALTNQGPFSPRAIETALDRLARQIQDIQRQVNSSLRLDDSGIEDGELSPRANWLGKVIGISSSGVPEPVAGLSDVTLTRSVIGGLLYPVTDEEADAEVTPTDYAYPPGDVRRYGALLNGVADDTAAFQDAHDALPASGGHFIATGGEVALIKGVNWTASDCFIQCDTILKHANTSAGYLIKIGSSSVTPARLKGYFTFDSQTNESAFASIVSAVRIAALIESDLTFDCDGFVYGVDCQTEGPVAYNKIHLLNMLNNRRGVYIRPGATGYCNRNDWYGGRFALSSGVSFNNQWSIYIEDSGANTPNDNQFWSPSFEGKAGAFYNEGFSNHVHGCRLEITTSGTAGTDFADPYIDQQGSGYSKFSASYTQQMLSMSKSIGAGTRVSDYSFTLAGTDYTEYAFPGAKIYVTVSGTEYECTVYSSSFSTDTTVRVVEGFITGNPSAVKVQLVKKASGAECEFFWPNDDVAGVSDAQFSSVVRLLQILARSSVTISSFDANRPAIRLRPGSSSTDVVLDVADLSGVLGLTITGNGYLNAKRFGLNITPAAIQSAITAPTGGGTQDAEARTAINSIITALETFGFVTPN